jgi:hypothetical protein
VFPIDYQKGDVKVNINYNGYSFEKPNDSLENAKIESKTYEQSLYVDFTLNLEKNNCTIP